jgi:hypothetical protein
MRREEATADMLSPGFAEFQRHAIAFADRYIFGFVHIAIG